jgi:hypothetical protein
MATAPGKKLRFDRLLLALVLLVGLGAGAWMMLHK